LKREDVVKALLYNIIISVLLCACSGISNVQPQATSTSMTGTITGKILTEKGEPLIKVLQGEIGYVVLICQDEGIVRGECLYKEDLQKDANEIISSICEIGDTSNQCKLHLMIGATKIVANGSYLFPAVLPGSYRLLVIIISNGIITTIELKNVDPVEAGKTVEKNFFTK